MQKSPKHQLMWEIQTVECLLFHRVESIQGNCTLVIKQSVSFSAKATEVTHSTTHVSIVSTKLEQAHNAISGFGSYMHLLVNRNIIYYIYCYSEQLESR